MNVKAKRMLSLVLTLILLIVSGVLPAGLVSAAAQVHELDGERTVFLGSFGRVSYNGKPYDSYKTFSDAFQALGSEGGRIVLSGGITVGAFEDIPGRKPITIVGVGTNPSGNLIDFAGQQEIGFAGDIAFANVNIKADAEAVFLTNGHKFDTLDDFDTYHTEQYVSGAANIIRYPNPPSITSGPSEIGGGFSLSAGTYNVICASTDRGTLNGSAVASLEGGTVATAVAGTTGSGVVNGNTSLTVNNGTVTKLVAGSDGGTVNGNVMTTFNYGAAEELLLGAAEGAAINGNVVLRVNGGTFQNITKGTGTVTGATIVISDRDFSAVSPDYQIRIESGNCEPQFDGANLIGFLLSDDYGIPARKATIDGAEVTAENAIYTLSSGVHTVAVDTVIKLKVRKEAKYVSGYEDGTFRPQNNMTRAEAITLLTRLVVDDDYLADFISSDYQDVPEGQWYDPYIGFFEHLGCLDKLEADYGMKILPEQPITRAEFTQLIYELISLTESSAETKLSNFTDVSIYSEFAPAINFGVSIGIITGYGDGTFGPDNNITRAEVVTMVNRLLGRTPTGNAGDVGFSDIAEHWASAQILAACNAENVSWTASETSIDREYVLTGSSTKDYVTALYDQSASLSAGAIRKGVDTISEQMKQDILNSPNRTDFSDKKTVIYVSEQHGSDDNDGRSPETPIKTLARLSQVPLLRNAAVLFERGGVYRGQIAVAPQMYYGAYGEGPKPLLMQSKRNYADPALWEETDVPNVWRCTELLTNVGIIGFDHDLFDYSDASYDETYGLLLNKGIGGFDGRIESMTTDLQFYSAFEGEDVWKACPLYLYSTEGNPGERFTSIEIGERFDIVDGSPVDVEIENLAFKFTGAHAVGVGDARNFKLSNCVFSWLGGSLLSLSFYGGAPVNYGNAVETGVCNGYHIEDNWMYQIYDTGVTHQCSRGTGTRIQKDVRYVGNLIEYVHWGIEFYNTPEGALPGDVRLTDGVYDAYNILRMGGYGWGSIVRARQTGARLYCGSSLSENINQLTEYNIFDRCAGYLLNLPQNSTETDDKNIYIQTSGNYLGLLKGKTVTCSYDAADQIANAWGDKNAVVIVIDPAKEPIQQYNK